MTEVANTIIEQANEQHAAGNYEAAISLYQQGISLVDAASPHASAYQSFHLVVGDMQRDLGRLEDAAASYRIVLANTPDHPDAVQSLAKVEKALKADSKPSKGGFLSKLFKKD